MIYFASLGTQRKSHIERDLWTNQQQKNQKNKNERETIVDRMKYDV